MLLAFLSISVGGVPQALDPFPHERFSFMYRVHIYTSPCFASDT